MLEFCAMCNNGNKLFSFLVRHHVVLGYCWCERCGEILVVPVFVVTGDTCGVILVVGVVRGVVTPV